MILVYLAPAASIAQRQAGITLKLRQVPLETVFEKIQEQTAYRFVYNDNLLVKAKKVSIDVRNGTIEAVLSACLSGQPFSYAIQDNNILITPKKEDPRLKAQAPAMPGLDTITVSGQVLDGNSGMPIPGTTILEKTTGKGAVSDGSGKFQINGITKESAVLQFSSIGYETQEIKTAGSNVFTIRMKPAAKGLDETVVIAYGTTTKRFNTGSIGTIKAEEIDRQPVTNVLTAIAGRVPGMVVTQTSGVPGTQVKVQIRGQSALDNSLSQNNPLIIIDGVPFESGIMPASQINSAANNPTSISSGGLSPLNSINPKDIERVEVLKDADATAIYGSRGANGVLLITTKKGKIGTTHLDVNVSSGISKIGRTMKMLDTRQYLQMREEAIANDGNTPSADPIDPGYAPDITLWDTTRYTDFKKLLIGNTARSNNFQASLSGGSQWTQFRIGANYHKETTVYRGDFSDNIASLNFNINHSTTDGRFHLSFSGMYSNDKNKLPRFDLTKYIDLPPNLRLYDSSGALAWDEKGVTFNSLGFTNPLSVLNQQYSSLNENLLGNLNISYAILHNLAIKVNFGYNTYSTDETALVPSAAIDPNYGSDVLPSASFANGINRSWIIEPQLTYDLATSTGKLNVIVGSTLQDKSGKTNRMEGTNYNSDLLLNSIAAAGSISATNDQVQYRYAAFFGRVNYNYKDQLILNVSARRDGSSRFGPDKQWANFGAAGLAWIFTNTAPFRHTSPLLSFGKLRASYGSTGNDQIGDYKFLNLWNNTTKPYEGQPGLYPSSLYNPDYSWEITKKFEAALELGFLSDNLFLTAAYYNNRCNNQLIRYKLPLQTGFTSVIQNFPGMVQNSGAEVTLDMKLIHTKAVTWSASFNISIPKNKLVSFPGLSSSSYSTKYVEGKSLSIIRGFRYLGVDPQTGLYTFEDVNKDGVIYNGDYQYFGNTDPRFYGGFQNNLRYKNFDLSFFIQFTKQRGANYISQLSSNVPGWLINQPTIVLSRWQHQGQKAELQKYTASFYSPAYPSGSALGLSDGAYADGSFARLKNVSISYRFPSGWLRKVRVSDCRVYLDTQNLLTITGYKGSDPETQNFYALPPLKTFVAGIQLNF